MAAYRYAVSRTGEHGLLDKPARDLKNGIINVIFSAVGELRIQSHRDLADYDLILLNADSEWSLGRQDHYFSEQRFLILPRIFSAAIEEFYHRAANRHIWHQLPLILPLVLFPSTDILVAAAKPLHGAPFAFHGMKPREIKRSLYGVDDLRYLRRDDLKRKALDFITLEGIRGIYTYLPESRVFLRTLTCNLIPPT